MSNIAGLTILGDAGDISAALALNCSTYLLIDDQSKSVEYAHQILEKYPDATVLIRRYGGVSNDARDVAEQCVRTMEPYWKLGIRHIIGWNEPDRREEGGWSVQAVADFAHTFYAYLHSLLPTARIHFPAFTNESAYQAPAQGIWLPAAQQFDDLDLHAYGRGAVARYLRWAESFLPGKPTWITESNYGLGNPRPSDYGMEIIDTVKDALRVPQCQSVVTFTWNWPNPEPDGWGLCLQNDVSAQVGLWTAAQMQTEETTVQRLPDYDYDGEPIAVDSLVRPLDAGSALVVYTPDRAGILLQVHPDLTISSPLLDQAFAVAGDIVNWVDEDSTEYSQHIREGALRIHELINELRRGGSGGVG